MRHVPLAIALNIASAMTLVTPRRFDSRDLPCVSADETMYRCQSETWPKRRS
ncbi:MAG: hypothetical protein R3C59_07755 [Planctomycetaceae bacterium]